MHPKMSAMEAAEFLAVTVQAVHQAIKKNGLSFSKSKNRVFFGHNTARQLFDLPYCHRVFVFQIVKGGTGKTSLAFNCAVRASLYGARVLCIDLDHQGNLTDFLGVDPENTPTMVDVLAGDAQFQEGIVEVMPGLHLFPSRIDNSVLDNMLMLGKYNLKKVYRDLIGEQKERFDVVVIDCPPSLGHSVAAAALAADIIVAPVNPDASAIKGLTLTAREITEVACQNEVSVEIRVVLNKFDKRTSLSHETLERLIKHPEFGSSMYSTYISASQEYSNTTATGATVFDALRPSAAKTDMDLLTREMLQLDDLRRQRDEKRAQSRRSGLNWAQVEVVPLPPPGTGTDNQPTAAVLSSFEATV